MAAALKLMLALGLLLAAAAARCAMLPMGPALAAEALPNGAQITLAGGAGLRIEFLAQGIVHVEATPNGAATLPTGAVIFSTPAAGRAELFDDGTRFILRQAGLNVFVIKNPLQVVVLRSDGSLISADVPGGLQADSATGLVLVLKHARAGERYFGMGLAGGPLDRRGRSMTMRNTDHAAYAELSNPLYSSTPFFHGHADGATYGMFLDNPSTAVFDFANANPEVLSVAATGGTLNYYLMAGPTPAAVAASFTTLTGATAVPPRWALGYLQAHFGYDSAAQVLSLAREFRNRAIPCDAFFLDLDYTDHLFTFSWNPITWPDPNGFNDQMEALGFKRVNILEPLLTVYDPRWAKAANEGWLVQYPGGSPLVTSIWMGEVSFFDFTKQAARDYFRAELRTFIGSGVSGLWADLNEPAANDMPWGIYDFEGKPRYEYAGRNTYALWETATLHDALLDAQPILRPFIVSRAGFAGIQRYAANWSGDTDSTWDSLRVQVQVANAMGLSGQNFFGADIGGFLGAPEAELFLRWLQFGAATPFMRNHSINSVPQREPWRYGDPYTAAAKAVIEWRYRLMPYLYGLFARAESEGTPVLAPTFFHFPADPVTHGGNGEFMLGAALLVAPVVTPGATSRSLYLPAGADWIDYYTDALFSGGRNISVNAPIHQLPLMVRAGSIVPMGPVRQFAAQAVADDSLLLDIFAGADGRFTLRDDDGASTAYRNGAYRDTLLQWQETTSAALLSASNVGGNLASPARTWWLQVRRWATAPARVLADGVLLPRATDPSLIPGTGGWMYSPASGRLIVRLPGLQASQTLRIER
jgi:alpha-glucosidase